MPGPTKLSKVQEKQYQTWKSKLPVNLQYEGDYDLRGLYKSNPNVTPSANMHFPDTYKLPNHPTFSDESIYFNNKTRDQAGHWEETDSSYNYIPYNTNVKDTVIERKMPDGGSVKVPKAIAPPQDIQRFDYTNINPASDNEVVDWMNRYINSPKYTERLSNFYKDPNSISKERSKSLNDIDIVNNKNTKEQGPGVYNAVPHKVFVDTNRLEGYPTMRRESMLAHELSHDSNSNPLSNNLSLSPEEENYMFDRDKAFGKSLKNLGDKYKDSAKKKGIPLSEYVGYNVGLHDNAPAELKSDIDALRFELYRKGIYDARTQDMTPDILEKAKNNLGTHNSFFLNRLQQHYNDKDLIDIMNKVAYNNNENVGNMAKYGLKMPDGGKVPKKSVTLPKQNPTGFSPLSYRDIPGIDLPFSIESLIKSKNPAEYYASLFSIAAPFVAGSRMKDLINMPALKPAFDVLNLSQYQREKLTEKYGLGYLKKWQDDGSPDIFKYGGMMPDGGKLPTYLSSTVNNPIDKDVVNWNNSYINSPKYNERLGNFYQYPDYVQRQRSNNASNVQLYDNPGVGMEYVSSMNKVAMSPSRLKAETLNNPGANPNLLRAEILSHELSHANNANRLNNATFLNKPEEEYILNRNKDISPERRKDVLSQMKDTSQYAGEILTGYEHDNAPSENKSDIDAVRYLLNKEGLYDARKSDINQDIIDKARKNKNIKNSATFKRLQNTFGDKDLIDIMNKVAINNTQQDNTMARNGKRVPEYPIDRYADGGPVKRKRYQPISIGKDAYGYPSSVRPNPEEYGQDYNDEFYSAARDIKEGNRPLYYQTGMGVPASKVVQQNRAVEDVLTKYGNTPGVQQLMRLMGNNNVPLSQDQDNIAAKAAQQRRYPYVTSQRPIEAYESMQNPNFLSFEDGGNLSRAEDYGSKEKPYPMVKSSDFAGGNRSYPIPTRANAVDALRLAGLHGREDVKEKVYKKYPDLKKADMGTKMKNLTGYSMTPTETYFMGDNQFENGGYVEQFREGSAFCPPGNPYTTDYSSGELGHNGIPPKVYKQGGKAKGKKLPPIGQPNMMGQPMLGGGNMGQGMMGMNNGGIIPKFIDKNRHNDFYGHPSYYQGGNVEHFNEGSYFADSAPNYISNYNGNMGPHMGIPPKVYKSGGVVPTASSFAGSPFPPDFNRYPSYEPAYQSQFPEGQFPEAKYGYRTSNGYNNLPDQNINGNYAIATNHESYPDNYGSPLSAASGIHINPANKGKFNALKKRTGKSTEELTHSSNPLTRKRAIFAQNAKKWHHADMGYGGGNGPYGDILPVYQPMNINSNNIPQGLENPIPTSVNDNRINNQNYQSQSNNSNTGDSFHTNFSLSTAAPLMGIAGLVNQSISKQNANKQSAINQRRVAQTNIYNPFREGTGATSLYANGGSVDPISQALQTLRDAGYDIEMG